MACIVVNEYAPIPAPPAWLDGSLARSLTLRMRHSYVAL